MHARDNHNVAHADCTLWQTEIGKTQLYFYHLFIYLIMLLVLSGTRIGLGYKCDLIRYKPQPKNQVQSHSNTVRSALLWGSSIHKLNKRNTHYCDTKNTTGAAIKREKLGI